jgi:proteasome assembly chaperone 4
MENRQEQGECERVTEALGLSDGRQGDTDSRSSIFHEFSTTILDMPVFFQVTQLGRSLLVWIGGGEGSMNDLSFSSTTPYDKGRLPSATQLMGNAGETTSTALAARLASKLRKPIYISYNVTSRDGTVCNEIEKRLMEEINGNPSKF